MEIRSFLAFELPALIREPVLRISGELLKSPLDVKWVKGDNIHITVVFLGNVEETRIGALKDEVAGACLNYGPFAISLKGMGCFPNRRRPRVLWLGLEGDMDRLTLFRDDLQNRLTPFGIKVEKRPFRPHLTLGRFRGHDFTSPILGELISRFEDLEGPVCTLEELVLFKSTLRPGGAIYTKMASWPLAGGA